MTNDPFDEAESAGEGEVESPLWAFTKYRALNRLVGQLPLIVFASHRCDLLMCIAIDGNEPEHRVLSTEHRNGTAR